VTVFYYQQFFRTALDGIDRSNIMSVTVQVGQVILLISFLVAVYESFIRGGDVRMLSVAAVKYAGLGLVLLGYATVFRDVNAAFNTFADFIANNTTGGADIFGIWMSDLGAFFNTTSGFERLFGLIAGGAAGVIGAVFVIVSYAVYPLTYAAFCFFYSLYGSILYVLGPVIISLLPAFGVGNFSRVYIINILTFHFWGVIYSILGALITAVNLSTVQQVLTDGSFVNGFVGLEQSLLLGVASVFYSLSIAVIPFLAVRIVRGETFGTIAHIVFNKIPLIPRRH
jgi:hypothetical protein